MDVTDSNTLKTVGETVRICREEGFKVDQAIAAFLARALDLVGTFRVECGEQCRLNSPSLTDRDVTLMARVAARELLVADSPFLCTVRMQIGMEQTIRAEKAFVEGELTERDNQLDKVLRAITDPHLHQDMAPHDFERLWQKVVDYVCVQCSMDTALDNQEARAEVSAALESVLPQYSMPRFVGMPSEEKAGHLEEVCSIVLGICAFNQSIGRGGLCLPSLASVSTYMHQANRLANEVEGKASDSHKAIQEYLALVRMEGASNPPRTPRVARLRQELTNLQQELAYLMQLREDILGGMDVVAHYDADRQQLLAQLRGVVSGKQAVPKEEIYPLFDQLGGVTLSLIEQSKLLEVRAKLFHALLGLIGGYSRSLRPIDVDKAQDFLRGNPDPPVKLWDRAPAPPEDLEAAAAKSGAVLVPPDADAPALQLGGYCPVSLVQRAGVLIPADASLGAVDVQGRVFGCSTREAQRLFMAQPMEYIAAVELAVRSSPELVKLLGMSELFPSLSLAHLVSLADKGTKCDFGTQTLRHVKDRNVDVNYDWNVWSLRRRALNLANLENKQTKSGQTVLSHFRRENETQVYLPKSQSTMTRADKGQSMPKKLRYIAGLRGGSKTKMAVVQLELELGQPHQH